VSTTRAVGPESPCPCRILEIDLNGETLGRTRIFLDRSSFRGEAKTVNLAAVSDFVRTADIEAAMADGFQSMVQTSIGPSIKRIRGALRATGGAQRSLLSSSAISLGFVRISSRERWSFL
jgi:hypothetical protein